MFSTKCEKYSKSASFLLIRHVLFDGTDSIDENHIEKARFLHLEKKKKKKHEENHFEGLKDIDR